VHQHTRQLQLLLQPRIRVGWQWLQLHRWGWRSTTTGPVVNHGYWFMLGHQLAWHAKQQALVGPCSGVVPDPSPMLGTQGSAHEAPQGTCHFCKLLRDTQAIECSAIVVWHC